MLKSNIDAYWQSKIEAAVQEERMRCAKTAESCQCPKGWECDCGEDHALEAEKTILECGNAGLTMASQIDAAVAAERERCIRIVQECDSLGDWTGDNVERAIRRTAQVASTTSQENAAVLAERERCARVAELSPVPSEFIRDSQGGQLARGVYGRTKAEIAAKIREGK